MKLPGESLVVILTLSAATLFTPGCSDGRSPAEVQLAQGVSKLALAAQAEKELIAIVDDFRELRNVIPDGEDIPLFFTAGQVAPEDIFHSMVVINPTRPRAEHLELLGDQIIQVSRYFGRMNWDVENPDVDPAFSKQEIAAVGVEDIKLGAGLERRFNAMQDKANVTGIVVARQASSAVPVVER